MDRGQGAHRLVIIWFNIQSLIIQFRLNGSWESKQIFDDRVFYQVGGYDRGLGVTGRLASAHRLVIIWSNIHFLIVQFKIIPKIIFYQMGGSDTARCNWQAGFCPPTGHATNGENLSRSNSTRRPLQKRYWHLRFQIVPETGISQIFFRESYSLISEPEISSVGAGTI